MSTEELNERLGEAGLAILDVRITGDWKHSKEMIRGAMRDDPNDVSLWADKLDKEQTSVLYCS